MDADYYFAGGIQLAKGYGFTEPYLWNYLDDPVGLPHPSHLYWMPLASILAAAGMAVSGSTEFWAGRMPTILLAGLIPVISALQSQYLLQNKKYAWVSGLLGVFTGMYVVYVSIPETFVLYLVLGGLVLLLLLNYEQFSETKKKTWQLPAAIGVLAGLMHLSRTDGIVWVVGLGVYLGFIYWRRKDSDKLRIAILGMGIFVIGYSLVMGPWYARNLTLFSSLMPPGNSRALWITDYNQTFYFPADQLTFRTWWAAGFANHLKDWWMAFRMNAGTAIIVQGMVFLLPLIAAGLWRNRQRPAVKYTIIMWIVSFGLMTIVFPFAGARGGFLHSGSAVQTVLWAAVPAGLEVFAAWGARKRNWKIEKAVPSFGIILIGMALVMTALFFYQKVLGAGDASAQWGNHYEPYQMVAGRRNEFSLKPDNLVMVNNPPGFYLSTGMASIVIPGGEIEQTLQAADYFGADFLILEEGQANLADLYESPMDVGDMHYLGDLGNARIFCFDCE